MSDWMLSAPTKPPTSDVTSEEGTVTPRGDWLDADLMRPLRFIGIAYLVYVLALALIDRVLIPSQYAIPQVPLLFHSLNAALALPVLGLAGWRSVTARLGRMCLPLVVVWLAVLPVIISYLLVPYFPPSQPTSMEGLLLRLFPMHGIVIVLVAWTYSWRQVAVSSMALGLLSLFFLTLSPSNVPPRFPPLPFVIFTYGCFFAISTLVSIMMDRLRAQQAALAQANAQLRHYNSTLESLTITRERNRVARELHDTLAHTLSGLTIQLETLKAYLDVDTATAKKLLDKTLVQARSGLQETRLAIKAIRASPLDDLGLSLALQSMATAAAERGRLHLAFSALPSLPPLATDIEQCIYRIAQEAVANVVYHAHARNLTVQLSYADQALSLVVEDDGCGFEAQHADKPGHFGLAGMHERALLAGGYLTVDSQPGQGTRVQFVLRLEHPTAEGH